MAGKMPQSDMNELKAKVLIGRIAYLSEELGDPARYFPALRAKGVLYPDDCDKIKAKVTASEKVSEGRGSWLTFCGSSGVRDDRADPHAAV